MRYTAIQNYINEFLFQNIGKVTKKYIELMKQYNPCSVYEEETNDREFVLYYEEQLLNFFNNVLEDCVLDDVELLLTEWGIGYGLVT